MLDLRDYSIVLFDIDGVLCEGERLLAGAVDTLAFLKASGRHYACVTNSAVFTPAQRAAKLSRLGLDIDADHIVTSALAVRHYLDSTCPEGARLFVIGMEGLQQALLGDGRYVADDAQPEIVVVGHDEQLNYDKCRRAVQAIRAGATFVATNPDVLVPGESGLVPEAGALMAYLEAATGVAPLVVGKPKPDMFHLALRRLGVQGAAFVVGDRLDTDVVGAHAAGLPAALVMTGVTDEATLQASPLQPDAVFVDLPAMLAAWQR